MKLNNKFDIQEEQQGAGAVIWGFIGLISILLMGLVVTLIILR